MNCRITSVFGAFRILRKRATEVGRPALAIWADAGEREARAVQAAVRDGAHAVEVKSLTLEEELRAMLADDQITMDELARLKLAPARLHRIAEQAHDVGEVMS